MRGFIREGIAELLDHPASDRIPGHVEVKDPASAVVDREPYVEKMEADGRDDEKVHAGNHVPMVPQEGEPPLVRTRIGL